MPPAVEDTGREEKRLSSLLNELSHGTVFHKTEEVGDMALLGDEITSADSLDEYSGCTPIINKSAVELTAHPVERYVPGSQERMPI